MLIKAGGGVSAGSGRFSVLSCSGSPLPVDDAEVVLATTGVGGASLSAEVDGLSLSDRSAPALCTSVGRGPANTLLLLLLIARAIHPNVCALLYHTCIKDHHSLTLKSKETDLARTANPFPQHLQRHLGNDLPRA